MNKKKQKRKNYELYKIMRDTLLGTILIAIGSVITITTTIYAKLQDMGWNKTVSIIISAIIVIIFLITIIKFISNAMNEIKEQGEHKK